MDILGRIVRRPWLVLFLIPGLVLYLLLLTLQLPFQLGRRFYVGGALTLLAALVALVALAPRTTSAPTTVAAVTVDPRLRTLLISAAQAPSNAGEQGVLRTSLVAGALPQDVAVATVLTDTNCDADAAGVSHCINRLQVGAQQVEIQHHHKMAEVACLSPGEKVNIRTA